MVSLLIAASSLFKTLKLQTQKREQQTTDIENNSFDTSCAICISFATTRSGFGLIWDSKQNSPPPPPPPDPK